MFGKIIKEYRTILKLSQEEMAYSLGISANYLSRIELGKTNPSGNLINRIIEIVTNDSTILKVAINNSELVEIIILMELKRLSPKKRTIILTEVIHLINLVNEITEDLGTSV